MSAILDQSLDEIIGNNKKAANNRARRNTKSVPRRATKQVNNNRRRGPVVNNRQPVRRAPSNASARVAQILSRSNRNAKVNVEGLPRDIKQDAVRVC